MKISRLTTETYATVIREYALGDLINKKLNILWDNCDFDDLVNSNIKELEEDGYKVIDVRVNTTSNDEEIKYNFEHCNDWSPEGEVESEEFVYQNHEIIIIYEEN